MHLGLTRVQYGSILKLRAIQELRLTSIIVPLMMAQYKGRNM
jgi:hypothetical protein